MYNKQVTVMGKLEKVRVYFFDSLIRHRQAVVSNNYMTPVWGLERCPQSFSTQPVTVLVIM